MKMIHGLALAGAVVAFHVAGSESTTSASAASWRSVPTSSSAVVLSTATTATLPWMTQQQGGGDPQTGDPIPVEPPESTAPTWRNSCSTEAVGETCSTGNGGEAEGFCSTKSNETNWSQCSARAMSGGNGGRCSASVLGGGAEGERCSTSGGGGFGWCSVMGDDGQAACSATGEATCSADAMLGTCSTHGTSGSGTACSVTEGSGGSCTADVSPNGKCSTVSGGEGHCSSWVADGGPVEDGDEVGLCEG